jgi:patatin-like phospholipase/acyl hydrolase
MSIFLEKFQNIEKFIEAYIGFKQGYEQTEDGAKSGPLIETVFKRLSLLDNFTKILMIDTDLEKVDALTSMLEKDSDLMKNMITRYIEKEKSFNFESMFDPFASAKSDDSSDDTSESSSVSSIDDINSQNSDTEDEEPQNELINKKKEDINKFMAKCILELTIRKQYKDIQVEKEE